MTLFVEPSHETLVDEGAPPSIPSFRRLPTWLALAVESGQAPCARTTKGAHALNPQQRMQVTEKGTISVSNRDALDGSPARVSK